MQRLTSETVKALGGQTAIATMVHAPVSTVHAWTNRGITKSRLEHLKLAAAAKGIGVDWDHALEPVESAAA